MKVWQVIILSAMQGLAELLPVSSSAHVIVLEKLLGLDPSSPDMTLLLVMLHTGTMLAVIIYFWRQWKQTFFRTAQTFRRFAVLIIVASVFTGIEGEALIATIERALAKGGAKGEVEQLFDRLELIAPALFAAGIFIIAAHFFQRRTDGGPDTLNAQRASLIGIVQGLCIPFRGFSRSGATISTGLLAGVERRTDEAFSFALAVVLTPPAMYREVHRLLRQPHVSSGSSPLVMGIFGMVCAFVAGLFALKWLSAWLESGRWYLFGVYCIVASGVVFALWRAGL